MANIQVVGAPLLATGVIRSADLGTAVPANGTTALDPALAALGYAGEDGISQTTERGTEIIRAMGGDEVRRIQTDYGVTFGFQLIDTNKTVLTEVYGADNVTSSGTVGAEELAIKLNKSPLPRKLYVFEIKDGENRLRIVVPNGQITNVGDITYSHSDVIRYEIEVTAFPDENGNQGYIYVSGPAAA